MQKLKNELILMIKEMFRQGYKAEYIAEKLGTSRATVYKCLDKSEKRAYNWH